jgi:hypothetical protein
MNILIEGKTPLMLHHKRNTPQRNKTFRNNIYIPFLLCLTSLSTPDMIGLFLENPGKKQPQRFLVASEMSRLRRSENKI